jgi:hypothetical protein
MLDYASIARNQPLCPATRKASSSTSLQLMHVNDVQGRQLLCDVSQGGQRPLIPEVDRRKVFLAFQGRTHPGIRATNHLMSAHVIWRGMSSGNEAWFRRDCQQCAMQGQGQSSACSTHEANFCTQEEIHARARGHSGPFIPTSAEGSSSISSPWWTDPADGRWL